MPTASHPAAVIIFDGVCSLCTWSVQFIIRRDPRGRFAFASLQSPEGARELSACGDCARSTDSIVLIQDGVCYTESGAALRIARGLSGLWPLLSLLLVVPRPLRDGVYRFVARRRYRWFGQASSCLLPSPELRQRLLGQEGAGPQPPRASQAGAENARPRHG